MKGLRQGGSMTAKMALRACAFCCALVLPTVSEQRLLPTHTCIHMNAVSFFCTYVCMNAGIRTHENTHTYVNTYKHRTYVYTYLCTLTKPCPARGGGQNP